MTRNPVGKATLVFWYAQLVSVIDSLGLCMFPVNNLGAWGPSILSELTSAYLGYPVSGEDLMLAGKRIQSMMRAFLHLEGVTCHADSWPSRFYQQPIADGPFRGEVVDRSLMRRLVVDFQTRMGWDSTSGCPSAQTLRELEIPFLDRRIRPR